MKEFNHENVNTFVGLSQDQTGVTVLWTFCSKGSLYEILGNNDIKVDFNFAISFAEDIAQVCLQHSVNYAFINTDLNLQNHVVHFACVSI